MKKNLTKLNVDLIFKDTNTAMLGKETLNIKTSSTIFRRSFSMESNAIQVLTISQPTSLKLTMDGPAKT